MVVCAYTGGKDPPHIPLCLSRMKTFQWQQSWSQGLLQISILPQQEYSKPLHFHLLLRVCTV